MAIRASVLQQQQAAKASGEPAWNVTVLAEGNSPETHTVYAPREGLAKTIAMAMYQQPLNGAGVDYKVDKLTPTRTDPNMSMKKPKSCPPALVLNPNYTRQAIITTFHGPTNARGSRIWARAGAGRVSIECDDSLSMDQNHSKAAAKLADKFGWGGKWVHGGMPNGDHVFAMVVEE